MPLSCFCCVAASQGGALEEAFSSLSRAKRLVERIPDAVPRCHGLVAMAEGSLLYKTGENESTIELIECDHNAFSSASAVLNSQFPYFKRNLDFAWFKDGRLRQNRSWSRSSQSGSKRKTTENTFYLLGRTEAALGNYGNAEQIYRSALENLKKFGLRSTEALTRDRMAQLLMKLGRKEEACVEWARALKLSETVQAVCLFEDITKRYAKQVKAEELLPIIEGAMVQRMEMQSRIDGSHLRLGRAEDLIWREHYVLAHWFVQPIWDMLRCEDRNASRLPPVIIEFCKVFGNPVWLSRMLTGDLSTAAEEIDVRALCEESLERVSKMLGTELSLTVAVEMAKRD